MATRTGFFRYGLMTGALVAVLGLAGTLYSFAQQGPPPGKGLTPADAPTVELILEGEPFNGFTGVSGLVSETEVLEFLEAGGGIVKTPGVTRYSDITLERSPAGIDALWVWRLEVIDGVLTRRNGTIIIKNSEGAEVQRWNFHNAWPSKWEGPSHKADGTGKAVESITFAVENLVKD
jgi:phage tail-like protein